ncbi:MAG: hypothetical protein ABJD97_15800 [Betaproteobacteria bacterium]
MNTPVRPETAATPTATPPADADGLRPTRTPLTPARVGDSIGEDADPEQDVAPNLGGEEQMQDA